MKRIFGTAKKLPPPPTLDETAGKISDKGDKVDDKIKGLDEQLARFKDQLKKTRPGPAQEAIKRRALQVLKQKKLYEQQREQLYQQQFNIDQTNFTVQSVKDTVETVQAMKVASKEMRTAFKANKELDIRFIDRMQDDLFDMMDMANDINEAMSRSYAVPEDVDESDLMAELDALEMDMGTEATISEKGPSYMQEEEIELPSVPEPDAHPATEKEAAIKS